MIITNRYVWIKYEIFNHDTSFKNSLKDGYPNIIIKYKGKYNNISHITAHEYINYKNSFEQFLIGDRLHILLTLDCNIICKNYMNINIFHKLITCLYQKEIELFDQNIILYKNGNKL